MMATIVTPTITPMLWFNSNAVEAMEFYCATFPGSEEISRNSTGENRNVLTCSFKIGALTLVAINGGSTYALSPAVSLMVACQDQAEIDRYWDILTSNGGQESKCGWLIDKFGLSWQIIPKNIFNLVFNADPEKAARSMAAMLKMTKLIVADLENV
jgi:predicted 3-demethylubiquinone-9 3-methyltransferase (glyoxalase superfamily)